MSILTDTVGDSWTLTKRALIHWQREPMTPVAGILFSFMFMLLFGFLFGGAMQVPGGGDYLDFVVPGILGMSMMFGLEATMLNVVQDKSAGLADRFRAMPMSRSAVVGGRAVADVLDSGLNLVALVGCGLLIGWRFDASPAEFAAALGLLVLLRMSMIWVGIFLGVMIDSPDATALVQILVFPLGFVSSVFVPTATMPDWLAPIADWNPLSATVAAVRELLASPGTGGDAWPVEHATLLAVGWPIVITFVFGVLAVRGYQRLGR
ncbi:ABC transporter permease [Solicola gregarius]|uniref:Transport permease protein n=1 Tax=Solicola gregarius TaxID=2908642 RepID=A0AA46TKW6_9ACTN|nr:ABC transporter permease [Solicola gregarius]UYM06799.1 ABC transporter permease [Solicola gregarius]